MKRWNDLLLLIATISLFPALAAATPTTEKFAQWAGPSPAICPAVPQTPVSLELFSGPDLFRLEAPVVDARYGARPLSCSTCTQAKQECSASCGGSPNCIGASCFCCVQQFTCDPSDPCNYTCICKPCCF
jgi:hypothetical protein